jgi:sugar-phosphatase
LLRSLGCVLPAQVLRDPTGASGEPVNELFMIAGPAGCGKTTLGVALAQRLGAPYLDLDDVTLDLVTRFLAEHPEQGEAEALLALRDRRYAELVRAARRLLDSDPHTDAVLIAPFTAEISAPDRWSRWLADLAVPAEHVHLVWLTLPRRVRLERMAARAASRDASLLAATDSPDALPEAPPPVVPSLVLDALLPATELVDRVLQRFGNGSPRA